MHRGHEHHGDGWLLLGAVKSGIDKPTQISPYLTFSAEEWGALRANTPLTLSETEIEEVRGLTEVLSIEQIETIYLPLSRLLNLYAGAVADLSRTTDIFLGTPAKKVPYIIGVAGSVAVGKSTASRLLVELLSRWPDHPRVELITTDGFLYPNEVLAERGLMERKGFPESYDVRSLLGVVAALKSGQKMVDVPLYSHLVYDVTGETKRIERPDIVIVEGLNVLQTGTTRSDAPSVFVSDFFDFTIFVDAAADVVRSWYIKRFLALRESAFSNPDSYFSRYASLDDDEARSTAGDIWDRINGPNLTENIAPTRERADLVLVKAPNHAVDSVLLRRL